LADEGVEAAQKTGVVVSLAGVQGRLIVRRGFAFWSKVTPDSTDAWRLSSAMAISRDFFAWCAKLDGNRLSSGELFNAFGRLALSPEPRDRL
jgi:hypothetical protein